MTFVQRMVAETGATAPDAARAFLVARDVSDARFHWDDIETLDGIIDGGVQTALMDGVDSMVEQLTRWYLRNPSGLDMASEIERDRAGFAQVVEGLRTSGPESGGVARRASVRAGGGTRTRAGCPVGAGAPALGFALTFWWSPAARAVPWPRSPTRSLPQVNGLFLDQAERRAGELPGATRWQRLANQA